MAASNNDYTAEEIAAMARIAKTGVLQANDRVEIVGLTSRKGLELNGRVGTVCAINGDNDGTTNPYEAQLPDNRYKVSVDYEETIGREVRPGSISSTPERKEFSLKRENLIMVNVGPGTLARDPEGKAILRRRGINISSTEESEAADPETAGFFPAILQGDVKRAREILEVHKNRGCVDPANKLLDATGDAPLLGGIQGGHLGIVKVLLEYGGDPNRICTMPSLREANLTYFVMTLLIYDHIDNGEDIVNALIDGGSDVHAMSAKGIPLGLAVQIQSDHAARMRICKKILEKGADPNQYMVSGGSTVLALPKACLLELGKYSQSDQLEVVQLLLDYGADPGKFVTVEVPRGESCNAIHIAVSHKKSKALKLFLSSEKGKAAVNSKRSERCNYPGENNGNGETALTMCCSQCELETYRECREMAVELLKAGADPDIEDHIGLSATVWLQDINPDPSKPYAKKKELHELVKEAKISGPEFWDSDKVKRFIDDGETNNAQCDNCGTWADAMFHDGKKVQEISALCEV